jgi:hypothetical protein
VKLFKNNHNAAVLFVNYKDTIDKPSETAEKVKQFLGLKLNTKNMALVVDPSLYREKKAN